MGEAEKSMVRVNRDGTWRASLTPVEYLVDEEPRKGFTPLERTTMLPTAQRKAGDDGAP